MVYEFASVFVRNFKFPNVRYAIVKVLKFFPAFGKTKNFFNLAMKVSCFRTFKQKISKPAKRFQRTL